MAVDGITVLARGLAFPEGPRWYEGALWFSDMRARTLNRVELDGTVDTRLRLDDLPGGLGFLPDGTPLLVSTRRKLVIRVAGDAGEVYADLRDLPGDFLNDMLVDEEGRVYVGVRTTIAPGATALPRTFANDLLAVVQPDGAVEIAAEGLLTPNGMVISPDGGSLVMAETYAQRILVFERLEDGSLRDRQVFAEIPGAYPDGICLDQTGSVWTGSPYTNEFLRVGADGTVGARLPMPGAVACAFGGPERSLLFLLCVDPSSLVVPGSGRPSRPIEDASVYTGGRIAMMKAPSPGAGWQ
jgi:sugar lactone lactonase YvrE